jgi:glycogen debranching enzyme
MTEDNREAPQDYAILATTSRADERTLVLKHGDSFALFDRAGAIRTSGLGELGIYHEGTRFLSMLELALERRRPLVLGSTVRNDDVLLVDLTNPDLLDRPSGPLARDSVHVYFTSLLVDGAWYARLRLQSYLRTRVDLELSMLFAADYADIFEVRGIPRARRGHLRPPAFDRNRVVLSYAGLDGVVRATELSFTPQPAVLTASRASFRLALDAHGEARIDLRVGFEIGGATLPAHDFDGAIRRSREEMERRRACCAVVTTNSPRFDDWVERSAADVRMMTSDTPHGAYPYAGVPWFSTAFGRDGILTAYQTLWIDPSLARGVLGFLAATQATSNDPENDAEPGKIIHEVRRGEMAALREVPFGRYYGSVDATPLFVMLAGAYYRQTADRKLVESIWPNIEAALGWLEHDGDRDGDGFIEYERRTNRGLASQGWKDSADAIMHANGELAEAPIALAEVQGYAYAARRAAAELARVLGLGARAAKLEDQASELKERFDRAFWCDELGTYALALDGRKRPCRVRASNAGHCLFSGIAEPSRAARVMETLLGDRSFSGWGIRTLDATAARYNPISYHNGSVWPHDNAVIAMGFSRYGNKQGAARILSGLFEASVYLDLHRMPELFCGFRQRPHEGPTLYPVACAPQAWAAGAVYMLLAACLGLDVDATRSRIVFDRPVMPAVLDRITIRNLRVGAAVTDVILENHHDDVGVHLERRDGPLEVVIVK